MLDAIVRYPVTAHVLAASVSLTLAKFAGADVSFLLPDYHVAQGEPWRLLSGTLLHGDPLHLVFNVYVMWAIGTVIEAGLGSIPTLLIYLVLAAGSMAAEFAVFQGGIGLSGVAYGLFGLLWLLSRRDDRFAGTMSNETAAFLVFYFFLCIVLTVANIMAIANVAHGAGGILGLTLGQAMTSRKRRGRLAWSLVFAGLLLASVAGATVLRPYVNLSRHRGEDLAAVGVEAMREKRWDEAIQLLRGAVRMNPKRVDFWLALSSAYRQAGHREEAEHAIQQAQLLAQEQARGR